MPLSKEDLEKHIKESIPDSIINIEDLRGDGCLLYTSDAADE